MKWANLKHINIYPFLEGLQESHLFLEGDVYEIQNQFMQNKWQIILDVEMNFFFQHSFDILSLYQARPLDSGRTSFQQPSKNMQCYYMESEILLWIFIQFDILNENEVVNEGLQDIAILLYHWSNGFTLIMWTK